MDTLRAGQSSQKLGLIVATLALIGATLAISFLRPGESAAQGPIFPAAWETLHAPLGGQEGEELTGDTRMDFDGDVSGFFDVFTELSIVGGSGNDMVQLTVVSHEFRRGGPLAGDLIARVPCDSDCSGVGGVSFR